uniref:SCP domain-containing protein n=1 Tax=Myripristis murdjan TaxID=586833 RepID=A0A667Y697_9TELE
MPKCISCASGRKYASFKQEFLDTHNAYRRTHQAPPLTFSDDLNTTAQKWADHLLSIKKLQHSNGNVGENIYYASRKEAVDSWYSEIKKYNWNSPGFNYQTGHFTQVVWEGSTELGVGLATDGYMTFVVGQYLPAGNMQGQFEQNVHKEGNI